MKMEPSMFPMFFPLHPLYAGHHENSDKNRPFSTHLGVCKEQDGVVRTVRNTRYLTVNQNGASPYTSRRWAIPRKKWEVGDLSFPVFQKGEIWKKFTESPDFQAHPTK